MRSIQRDLDRTLARLRSLIREQGFTQLEVQEALGWGRSYISQILTQQKALRVEQVLLILNVVGVDPAEFFGEVFSLESGPSGRGQVSRRSAPRRAPDRHRASGNAAALQEMSMEYEALVEALMRKELIELSELEAYVRRARAMGDLQTADLKE